MELEEAIKILKYQLANRNTDVYTPINYEAVEVVLNHLTKQEKIIELIEKECRYRLAFAKGIRRREKRNPDDFNQGLEFESATIMNLLSGEPHWEYEGKYFDDIDRQVEKLKANEEGE